jgi:hypothetical protein
MDVEGLQPLERTVGLKLARHAHDDGREAFPSVGRIARWSGYTERSVQTAIDALQYFGFLELQRLARQRYPAVYRIVGEVREQRNAKGKPERVFVLLPPAPRPETISTLEAARRWRQSGNKRRPESKSVPPRVEISDAPIRINPVRESGQESKAPASPFGPDGTPEGTDDETRARFFRQPDDVQAALRADAVAFFELDKKYHLAPVDREQRELAGALLLFTNPRLRPRKTEVRQ